MNLWIYAILSFLIPGLGQAVSEKYVRAIIMFIKSLMQWSVFPIMYAKALKKQ